MSRISDLSLAQQGPLLRLVRRVARRKVKQLTGRETEHMLAPLDAYARAPRLLFGVGMLEDATARLHRVPERLKVLAELKAATLTHCEYCIDNAVGVSSTPVTFPDELFDELRARFDEAQLVELTNVIALENMRGRFNLALGIGSAGFTEGMVCAVPDSVPPPSAAASLTPAA